MFSKTTSSFLLSFVEMIDMAAGPVAMPVSVVGLQPEALTVEGLPGDIWIDDKSKVPLAMLYSS